MKLNFKDGKQNKIHIHVDGEYRMTVDRDFVLSGGYYDDMDIGQEELAELEKAVSSRRVFNKAVDLLSRRDHSSAELLLKLRQRGMGDGAPQAIEKLIQYGYIDDRHFAENYTAELIRSKGFGKKRIIQELYRKGISREIIDEVTEGLEFDCDGLADIIERKYAKALDTQKGVSRAINALMRMGYSYSEIKAALEEVTARMEETDA